MTAAIKSANGHIPGVGIDLVLHGFVCPSLNRYLRMHWRDRHRLRDECGYHIQYALRTAKGPRGEHDRARTHRAVTIDRIATKHLDYDNLVGGAKPLVDALVKLGLIAGDTPELLTASYGQAVGELATRITIRATSEISAVL